MLRILVSKMFFLLLASYMSLAHAIEIVIEQGVEDPVLIAVVPFAWSQTAQMPALDIAAVVRSDLERSGRFRLISEEHLPARPYELQQVDFSDWRLLGIENLLIGELRQQNNGDYQVLFRLLDVYSEQQLAGFKIITQKHGLRHVAHQISDVTFEKLLGEKGAFATQIAYVTAQGSKANKYYTLQIADADGYNPQVLLQSGESLLSPAWSHDGERLAYVSFEGNSSAVYVQQINTGQRRRVAAYPGINSAPAWSMDDTKLALTLSKDGNTEIYLLDLGTGALRRLTEHMAIDTEPNWSPDGKRLVFTSDRGGSPQIYELTVSDGTVRRLTFIGNYNARPVYSPDGQSIAMVHRDEAGYHIALLDLASGRVTVLTNSKLDESPSFAPNGNMIIYATSGGSRSILSAVSVDGLIHQRLAQQQGDVRDPVWGPYRQ